MFLVKVVEVPLRSKILCRVEVSLIRCHYRLQLWEVRFAGSCLACVTGRGEWEIFLLPSSEPSRWEGGGSPRPSRPHELRLSFANDTSLPLLLQKSPVLYNSLEYLSAWFLNGLIKPIRSSKSTPLNFVFQYFTSNNLLSLCHCPHLGLL